MKRTVVLLLLFFPFYCNSQTVNIYPYSKNDNSLLWEISGGGIAKPAYLFGTIHLLCKDEIKPGKNLKGIIKNADAVYFEMDLDDMSGMLSGMQHMQMKNDTSLNDLLSAAELKKVSDFFKDSLKMPLGLMQKIKPILLQAFLFPKLMPCKSIESVEQVIMKIAKEHGRSIEGLETVQFQSSLFDSIPYKVQALELLKGIDSINFFKKSFDSLLLVYKSQNLSDIEKLFSTTEFEVGQNKDILLYKRNLNWVAQLKTLMHKKALFVAVGAGHLVGSKGLIALLRKEGYTLKPVENIME